MFVKIKKYVQSAMGKYKLIHDEDNLQYIYKIEGHVAELWYNSVKENIVSITHVGVPKEIAGKGIAGMLVLDVLKVMESKGLKIIPVCPYVIAFIDMHPEWKRLVM